MAHQKIYNSSEIHYVSGGSWGGGGIHGVFPAEGEKKEGEKKEGEKKETEDKKTA